MPIGEPFVQLFEVESTNNYAITQVQASLAGHGCTWLAHSQTNGKGQRGKVWLGEPGKNIAMSILIDTSALSMADQFALSAMVALCCHNIFFAEAMGHTTIKWPNDIYWKDRKAGGILIENIVLGKQWKYAVVGIGLNINQTVFHPSLSNPVSLAQITGKRFNVPAMAQQLCADIELKWQQLLTQGNLLLFAGFQSAMYKLNEIARFKMGGAEITAKIIGVDSTGALLLYTGQTISVGAGQLQWVIN